MADILYNLFLRPDKDSEVGILVPEGVGVPYYDVASKQIRFRARPESWPEALNMLYGKNVALCSDFGSVYEMTLDMDSDMVFTDKDTAKAFVALAKLKTLNRMWVADYKAGGKGFAPLGWAVEYLRDIDGDDFFCSVESSTVPHILVFPTKEMADEFIDMFKSLLEEATIMFK